MPPTSSLLCSEDGGQGRDRTADAGVIASYGVVMEKKILGGQYGLAFIVPPLNARFNSYQFNASAESAGISDILFQPIVLGRTKGQGRYTVNYSFIRLAGTSIRTRR
jgi:hypothetical protein